MNKRTANATLGPTRSAQSGALERDHNIFKMTADKNTHTQYIVVKVCCYNNDFNSFKTELVQQAIKQKIRNIQAISNIQAAKLTHAMHLYINEPSDQHHVIEAR